MVFLLFMAMGTYLASLGPVANSLLIPLESQYTVPDMHDLRESRVYVVLMEGMGDKGMDVFACRRQHGKAGRRVPPLSHGTEADNH
jgi:hypothetical protein